MSILRAFFSGTALACALAALTDGAAAQDAKALNVRALAATCASCHGTAGRSVEAAAVPGLAGLPAAELIAKMKAFKSGAAPATVMHQLAKGYSEAQVEQLAAYFAAQPRNN